MTQSSWLSPKHNFNPQMSLKCHKFHRISICTTCAPQCEFPPISFVPDWIKSQLWQPFKSHINPVHHLNNDSWHSHTHNLFRTDLQERHKFRWIPICPMCAPRFPPILFVPVWRKIRPQSLFHSNKQLTRHIQAVHEFTQFTDLIQNWQWTFYIRWKSLLFERHVTTWVHAVFSKSGRSQL